MFNFAGYLVCFILRYSDCFQGETFKKQVRTRSNSRNRRTIYSKSESVNKKIEDQMAKIGRPTGDATDRSNPSAANSTYESCRICRVSMKSQSHPNHRALLSM